MTEKDHLDELLNNAREKEAHCSFCGKPQRNAFFLFAGPSALICDECIDTISGVLAGYRKAAELGITAPPKP